MEKNSLKMIEFLKSKIIILIKSILKTKRSIFVFGLIISLIVTLKEVIGMSYNTFQIFSFGSTDFWSSINPYLNWEHYSIIGKPLDVFLYSPLFSILFTPFTLIPGKFGVIFWNFFNYSLFSLSIFTLPKPINFKNQKFIFFFTSLLLYNTMLSVQFNPIVAALFLFSFTLLEKKHGFWAVLLISLSGFTKIYGIFQLVMLLFYPNFWKNLLYVVLIGIILLALPIVHLPINNLIPYYYSWVDAVTNHAVTVLRFYSIYRPIHSIYNNIGHLRPIISLFAFSVVFLLAIKKLNLLKRSFPHRIQFLGILMSWAILFGFSTESHTYVIAIVGYVLWYLNLANKTRLAKFLLWTNFILLEIMPIDFLCPPVLSNFILGKLSLGAITFAFTWFYMVYTTFLKQNKKTIQPTFYTRKTELTIILPMYNPISYWETFLAHSLAKIADFFKDIPYKILVVNDGTTTNIENGINHLNQIYNNIEFISYKQNMGKGFAIRKGLQHSNSNYYIYVDWDFPFGEKAVYETYLLLKNSPNTNLVIGERNKEYYLSLPIFRRWMSRSLRAINYFILYFNNIDTQAGLKGLNNNTKNIFLTTTINSFIFELEFIKKVLKLKLHISFLKVKPRTDIQFTNFGFVTLKKEIINFGKIIFK